MQIHSLQITHTFCEGCD